MDMSRCDWNIPVEVEAMVFNQLYLRNPVNV